MNERRSDYGVIHQLSARLDDFMNATIDYRSREQDWRTRVEAKLEDVATKQDIKDHDSRIKRLEGYVAWISGVAAAVTVIFTDLGKKLVNLLS